MKTWRTLGISLMVALALLLGVPGTAPALGGQLSLDDQLQRTTAAPGEQLAGDGQMAGALLRELTIDELTARADSILVGEVTDIACYQEGEGYIYTLVTTSVEQNIKGAARDEVTVRLLGGEVGEKWLWVSGTPSFQLGEMTVVFLEKAEGDVYELYDWHQGKLTIEDGWVLGKDQSLTDFIADIRRAMEVQSITPDMSVVETTETVEVPVVSRAGRLDTKEFQASSQNIKSEDFEGAWPNDWTIWVTPGYTDAYWGDDAYNPHWGSWSGFCADDGVAAVNPPSHYPNDMRTWMTYGPFSLADATAAELNFYRWVKTELDYDYLSWMASVDDYNWYGWRSSGDSGGWQHTSFDLTDVPTLGNLCGQPEVWIAFVFTSDASITDEGAFIDDIDLWKDVVTPPPPPTLKSPLHNSEVNALTPTFEWYDVPDADYYGLYISEPPYGPDHLVFDSEEDYGPIYGTSFTLPGGILSYGIKYRWNMRAYNEAGWGGFSDAWDFTPVQTLPHIDSISPSSGSAGTGFQVTIGGTGFGSTQGSSTVSFFYKTGEPRIEAPVVSWSDTSIVCEVPVATINSYPASASSGPVIVHTAGGDSNGYGFFVTFSAMGFKWPGTNPMGEEFRINPNTADCTGEWRALIDAMQTWNDVDNANFYFEYGGSTTATDFSQNGINEITWVQSSRPYIAACYLWGVGNTITECDVVFNDFDFTWDTSGSPTGSEMDVQSIATHELGHCLGLRDLYGSPDSEKTMYGFGSYGETKKRTLEPEDIAGIRWIYPGTGTRGQYHIRVTNNDDDDLTVHFKSDIDAGYRNFAVPAGEIVTSWWEAVPSGSHQVTIKWTDPDKGTEDTLTSPWLDVPVEGDTEFSFTIPLYEAPAPPTATTNAATLVEETTATLNGVITNDGGEACEYRFEYDTDSGEPYAYNTGWTGSKTTGQPFSESITGLSKGTKYYFRVQAKNSAGTASGSELTFLTKPDAPTSFSATTAGTTEIDLSWTKGDGAQKTKIQRKQGSYPTDRDDGTEVCFDTGTYTTDTGLTPGTTYYYRAWSYVQGSEQWSDDYAQALATTTTIGAPTVTTSDATEVTIDSATLNGSLDDMGTASSVDVSFAWGTTSQTDPTAYPNETTPESMGSTGSFNAVLGGLTPGVTYYFRAKAVADGISVYGGELSFTTEQAEETGTIQVDSNLTGAQFSLQGPANYSGTTPWSETDAPVGTYTITWGEMTGYETPSPESKNLEPEEIIQFHGDYVRVVGPDWRASMTASAVDEGSNPELEFGIHPDASDGYDSGIDLPAPPPQPGALFEAYFSIPDPTFNRLNKDFRGETPNQWILNVKSTSQDIELSWSTDDVPEDLFLRLTGGDVDVDMSTVGSVTLPAGSHTVMIVASDLAIVTVGLPGGRINRDYDAMLMAAGGMEPYTWAIVEGTLPDGLGLDAATGVISGLPTAVGRFSLTVEVTDAVSGTADRNLQIVVVWSVPMVADAGTEGSNADLEFGVHPDATDGYDSGIDLPAPPPDPGALFEAYFSIDAPTFSRLNKDFRGETPNQWTLKVKSTSQSIQLTWDAGGIPAELWALMDTGTQKIDMKAQDSVLLPAGEYTITISVSELLEIHLDLKAGWNLVSVPVIPVDPSMAAVFAGTEVVYAWNAVTKGYYVPTEVEAWRGYWVAVTSDTIITISGVPVHDWTAQMSAGWNLVGSLMSAVDFSLPDTDPPGKVEPFTYRWNPDLPGYDYSTTIEPKMGHWVAATEDCVLHLPPEA